MRIKRSPALVIRGLPVADLDRVLVAFASDDYVTLCKEHHRQVELQSAAQRLYVESATRAPAFTFV